MIGWFKRWYIKQKRMIDRETLWEHLKDFSRDREHARRAFKFHMEMDRSTYGDMTEQEKQAYVDTLYWGRGDFG